jgi:hypothetical protein
MVKWSRPPLTSAEQRPDAEQGNLSRTRSGLGVQRPPHVLLSTARILSGSGQCQVSSMSLRLRNRRLDIAPRRACAVWEAFNIH